MREQLRRFGIPVPEAPRGQGQPPRGEGSGFIVSPDGYILTNAHVVRDATEVRVKMTDRREYPATVIGLDDRTDVAVIKIAASVAVFILLCQEDIIFYPVIIDVARDAKAARLMPQRNIDTVRGLTCKRAVPYLERHIPDVRAIIVKLL